MLNLKQLWDTQNEMSSRWLDLEPSRQTKSGDTDLGTMNIYTKRNHKYMS